MMPHSLLLSLGADASACNQDIAKLDCVAMASDRIDCAPIFTRIFFPLMNLDVIRRLGNAESNAMMPVYIEIKF